MKILSVVEAFCLGGTQTVLADVALSLPEHDHRMVHFSRANAIIVDATLQNALISAGIECLEAHWDALRIPELRAKLLDDFRPDVVLFHWWGKDPWMPWVLSQAPHPPTFICVLHHHDIPAKQGYDRYVLVSRTQLDQVSPIAPWRVRVIPNGVDLRRFPPLPQPRADQPVAPNRPFVVGRLSELRDGKIPADWVQTLASFRLEHTRFVIAGNGPLFHHLLAGANQRMGENQISFPGYIPRSQVPALLRTFDVFCYTSPAVECCPLVILEAMAAGLPVVAEARGGMPAIVIHGKNGLLANSFDEIGQHLRTLRDDKVLRDTLSRGALATAENFSLTRQTSAYRQLLAEISQQRAQSSPSTS